MTDSELLDDFRKVTELAGVTLLPNALSISRAHAPKLPHGKMAVYVFTHKDGTCLKVGKAGPRSHARFTSQHYLPSSCKSNLAKSLIFDSTYPEVTEANVGEWIRHEVDRVNVFLDIKCTSTDPQTGIFVLTLLESFLQCRLNPKYEGFKSQR